MFADQKVEKEESCDDNNYGDDENEQDDSLDSDCSGEKAIYEEGKGVNIVDCLENEMRNVDDVINESCQIKTPSFLERGRALCQDFSYFDKELEVFTDEEGV